MTIGVKTSIRNAWVQTVADAIDAGATGGKIQFYDGARPATGAAITSQTLLGTVVLSDPCGTVVNGVLTLAGMPREDPNAAAVGPATWARITDSNDGFVCDASVTGNGGGGDIQLNSTTFTVGGIIRITSGTLTAGNA